MLSLICGSWAQLPRPQQPGRQMHKGGYPNRRGRVVLARLSEAGFQFRGPWTLDSGTIAAHRFEAVDQQPLGEAEPDLMAHPRGQRLELRMGTRLRAF